MFCPFCLEDKDILNYETQNISPSKRGILAWECEDDKCDSKRWYTDRMTLFFLGFDETPEGCLAHVPYECFETDDEYDARVALEDHVNQLGKKKVMEILKRIKERSK